MIVPPAIPRETMPDLSREGRLGRLVAGID